MKKFATIIMLIALLIVGYSVGNAIAKNHSNIKSAVSDGINGVYVVEEEYDVVETPSDSATNMQSNTNASATASSNTNAADGMVIEEDVVESGD
ncbi:MAG: hypothetical protein J6T72_03980 [Alphaproteobacteria bacterium]|nr:hypothetical protein [Alphaproteobacteria bacterium]